nr:hypothetical protein [Salimicrobium flavidum]
MYYVIEIGLKSRKETAREPSAFSPKLVTSISAALKKESGISLGNIVGSNIFNILLVLVASAGITTLSMNDKIFTDVLSMIVLSLLLFVFSRMNHTVGKREGLLLVVTYVVYIILRN